MKPRIYMVDDEPDFLTIMHAWLEPKHSFVGLKDGDELLGALKSGTPDLVILDLNLPGADGFELCRRLRATPGLEKLPVLFLTASHEFSDYRKNFGAGGNAFLTKPVGRRQLLAAVEALLEENRPLASQGRDVGGGD